MPHLLDLLKNLATDTDLQERWQHEDQRDAILNEYDLDHEQRHLIDFVIDDSRPYCERQRALGQAIESEFARVALLPWVC